MLYGRYDFRCRFQSDAHLPLYKGSTIRGVFGHALKSVVCALRRQSCATCLLKSQCLYTMVFETHLAVSPPAGAKIASAPHPFVIRPPFTTQTGFGKGDIFIFSLLLFGGVNQYLPYLIHTFDSMGNWGIGKKVDGRRASYTLETVSHQNRIIYTSENQILQMNGAPPRLTLSDWPEEMDSTSRLTIHLKTPLRLKFKNRYATELPFHIFTRAMLRRISILLTFYNGGEPPLDYRGLTKRAEAIRLVDSTLCWNEWERYSNRQKQKTPMGGMLGTVTYEGALREFRPFIEFCEKTNLGKQTSFGLGEIAVEK